jgi:alpha-beta hydrolase superfamily lysophospholipase
MNQAIERRELVTLDGQGVLLRGTFHKAALDAGTRGRIGIVFLNSLSLPRAATGDSAVYWANAFADAGYPSFRFDLPGLGDTAGKIPNELLNFINAGEYGSITSAKVKELVERFALAGVVLVGHCAGTVSALYAASGCSDECKGLILLDPYFHLPQAVRPKVRRSLSEWALHSRFGGLLSNIYDRLRSVRRYLNRNAPPPNANFRLLSCWKKLAATGLPILLCKAPGRKAMGTKPRVGEFDYLQHVLQLAGSRSQVVVELIEGTDHSFANRAGRVAVCERTEAWLHSNLPIAQPEGVAAAAAIAEAETNNSSYTGYKLDCLHG